MAVIWDDSFKVGNTTIDNQHQTLFKWMNKLEDLLNGKGGRTTANDIISYLRTYTRTHFCYEELCMQRYSCPVAEKNSAAHDKFMEAFQKFETKLNADGVSDRLLRELHKSIEDWLVNHIYKIDTKLRACVTE